MGKRYTPNIGETAKIITSKIRGNLGNKPKKRQHKRCFLLSSLSS